MAVAPKSPFYNEDHEAFRGQVIRFVEREISQSIDAWETAGMLPRELHRKAAEAGLLQIGFPEVWQNTADALALPLKVAPNGTFGPLTWH